MSTKDYEIKASRLLRACTEGVLSTISEKNKGYPFGSFTTFATTEDRTILIYASNLAQHTKNINANPKVSFTLFSLNKKGDKQNSQRLTIQGNMGVMQDKKGVYRKRFQKFFPKSKAYEKMHDFSLYAINIEHIRWIGGFGEIAWLKNDFWKKQDIGWLEAKERIISHMNKDHQNSIASSLHAQHGLQDNKCQMLELTIDGYYVRSSKGIFFIFFDRVCLSMKEYKDELVRQAHVYREYELV